MKQEQKERKKKKKLFKRSNYLVEMEEYNFQKWNQLALSSDDVKK